MWLQIDPGSRTSVYRQICDQIKRAVATGALRSGDRLPPIRGVAEATRTNRNTIARAYAELEHEGVIVSQTGRGSFVAPGATAIRKRERLRLLEEMLEKLLVESYHFQIPLDELRELFEQVAERVREPDAAEDSSETDETGETGKTGEAQ